MSKTTAEFAEDVEPGWYFMRFRHGEDAGDPDDWGPWVCVEVDGGGDWNSYEPRVDFNGEWENLNGLENEERYQWGDPITMPDDPQPPADQQRSGEDRKVPDGYTVFAPGAYHVPGWAPRIRQDDGAAIIDMPTKEDAIAACYDHRDRIRTEARAEWEAERRGDTVEQVEHAIWAVYSGECRADVVQMAHYQSIVDRLTCLPSIIDRIRTEARAEWEVGERDRINIVYRQGKEWAYDDIARHVEHPDWACSWTDDKQAAASVIQSAIDRARAEGRAEGLAEAVREPDHPHQGQPFRGQTPVPACVLKRACPVCNAVKGALCFNPKSGHPWATTAHSRRGRPTEEGADDAD